VVEITRLGKANLLEWYVLIAARRFHQALGRAVGIGKRGKEIVESAILLNDHDDVLNRGGSAA
jgi:hypothetical protein